MGAHIVPPSGPTHILQYGLVEFSNPDTLISMDCINTVYVQLAYLS